MSIEAPNVPWVRLNAATFQDARLIRAGFWGTVAWPGILMMAKLHGWRGGKIPKDELDEALLAHHMNAGVTDETVTRGLASGIEALFKVGLLSVDGAYYCIRNWARYQSDPSNADRQQRSRDTKGTKTRVTEVTERNGSNGDVTGRDVTGRDVTEPPQPPSEGGGSASPGLNGHDHANGRPKTSTTDIAAMDAILTKQAAFYGPASAQPESSKIACELRKRLRAGTLPTTEVIRFLGLHEPAFRDTANAARANCRREARAARNGGPTPTFDDDGGDDAHG